MTLGWPKSGRNWAAAYVAPGIPWVTGSVAVTSAQNIKLEFPCVTKYFTVKNTGAELLHVGFTSDGVAGANFFTLETSASQDFDIRVRDLYLGSPEVSGTTFDVIAGLTSIKRSEYPEITSVNPAPTGSQFVPNIG